MLYTILLKSHSGLRWLLLAFFILALLQLARKGFSECRFNPKTMVLLTLITAHVQLLIGLALYFISPKVVFAASAMKETVLRFYLVEHISLMVIALIILTIGYSKTKNKLQEIAGARKAFYYYLVSFILILASIPWPFRIAGADWF